MRKFTDFLNEKINIDDLQNKQTYMYAVDTANNKNKLYRNAHPLCKLILIEKEPSVRRAALKSQRCEQIKVSCVQVIYQLQCI